MDKKGALLILGHVLGRQDLNAVVAGAKPPSPFQNPAHFQILDVQSRPDPNQMDIAALSPGKNDETQKSDLSAKGKGLTQNSTLKIKNPGETPDKTGPVVFDIENPISRRGDPGGVE